MPRVVERYCIHTILLLRGPIGAEGVGFDIYNEPLDEVTPTSLTLAARVEFDNIRILDDSGEEVVCAARVFIPPTYADPDTGIETPLEIGGQDRIVFEGRTYALARRDRQEGWPSDAGRHWDVYIR
jgi:hypothetical protein